MKLAPRAFGVPLGVVLAVGLISHRLGGWAIYLGLAVALMMLG